jgi:hypothetical protein
MPRLFAKRLALGACAVLIGLLSPATVAAQSRWSGVATLGYIHRIAGYQRFYFHEGGPAALVGAFFKASSAIGLGLSLEFVSFGTKPYFYSYNSIPGETMQQDERLNILDAALSCRIRKASGNIRPFAAIGGGISIWFWKNTWVAKDASGSSIPGYPHSESFSEAQPLIVFGVGVDFPQVLGDLGVCIHGRWRMIPSWTDGLDWGHYLAISIGISIN